MSALLNPGRGAAQPLRVLVVDEAPPHPPDSGKRLRTWHLLRRLAQRHQVVLLCYGASDAASARAIAALAEAGIECHLVAPPPDPQGWRLHARLLANCLSPWPYSVAKHHTRRFQAALQELCRRRHFDLVQVEWTPYASHLHRLEVPHLIASHNIEAQIWRRRAAAAPSRTERLYFHWQAAKMERFERQAFRRAQFVTTVSTLDRDDALRFGAAGASVVANGVDTQQLQPARTGMVPDRMLFLGSLDWHPNQDAVEDFVDNILPRIRAARPQAHLQVVGRRPSPALRRRLAGREGVELIGDVGEVRPWLQAAAAVVVPLRIGGGSRIKIIEALAMEKAVVTTTIGAEGLDVQDGTHLRIADGPAGFAQATLQLLESPEAALQLGRAGRRWARERHDWDDCALALEQAWRKIAGTPQPEALPA